jgi:uncharacterized membrane protein/YHS domain-containing protein
MTGHQSILGLAATAMLLFWAIGYVTGTAATADDDQAAPANAPTLTNAYCPLLPDEPIEPEFFADFEGQRVYLCCQRCLRKFTAAPQEYREAVQQVMLAANVGTEDGHEDEHAAGDSDDHGSDEDAGGEAAEIEAAEPSGGHDHGPDGHERSDLARTIQWAGNLHPMLVHFPIALLLAGWLAEMGRRVSGSASLGAAARFCVLLGAAGAVLAAGMGWAHAWFNKFPDSLSDALFYHRWLGTCVAIAAVVTAVLCEVGIRKDSPRWRRYYVLLLTLVAVAVGAAGHFGGILTHGIDYYRW